MPSVPIGQCATTSSADDANGNNGSGDGRTISYSPFDKPLSIAKGGQIYDPKFGRFLQADPFVQDPLNTQSLNRYSYVWNNPLNATDPSG